MSEIKNGEEKGERKKGDGRREQMGSGKKGHRDVDQGREAVLLPGWI